MFFFEKKSVGVSIADHVVEVVELSKEGRVKITSSGRVEFEHGIVERGRIKNASALARYVRDAFQHATPKPIPFGRIVAGFPESQIYLHVATFTGIPMDKDIEKLARENIPVPLDELLYSWRFSREKSGHTRVVIAATSKVVVSEWHSFFMSIGVENQCFDVELFAIFRNLFKEFPREPVLIVDIGRYTTNISLFDFAGLLYSRSMSIGGAYLTHEVAGALKITVEEAERRKQESGLEDCEHPVSFALIKGLGDIMREMHSTLDFLARSRNERVSQIVFAGGSSRMSGLAVYMEANFRVPIIIAPQTSSVEAIGYALRGLESKWDATDPKLSMDVLSRHISKPILHWSLPQASRTNSKMTRSLLIAFFIAFTLLLVLVYLRYLAGE